jgi:GT2 family glycosyltransferase
MDMSIIIVNWNTRDLLVKCVRSILSKTVMLEYEIIVVDNDSSDGSCSAIREEFPDVRLIQNKSNLGFAKANNIGIGESRGKYLALINSDIEVLQGCFDVLYGYMEGNPEVGMAAPKILNSDLSYQLTCRKFPSLWNDFVEALGIHAMFPHVRVLSGEYLMLDLEQVPYNAEILGGCFWFIRRSAIEATGLLDERFYFYGEDKDLCIRFSKMGWNLVYNPAAQAIHYGGASSSKMPEKFNEQLVRAQLQFWKKHFNPPTRYGFIMIKYINLTIRLLKKGCRFILFPSKRRKIAGEIRIDYCAVRWLLKNTNILSDNKD